MMGGVGETGRWRAWLPAAWSWVLALVVLGPVAGASVGRGFVLSYDMVWVDDLALTPTALGLGSGLPRAVPSDAVVAVLDEVVPGGLLQVLVLLLPLALGGVGAARLLPRSSGALARLVAVTLWVWNPLVVERLLIGHWPLLVGYAVLPWVAAATWAARPGDRPARRLWVLVPLGCLSASAGLMTTVVLLVAGRATSWRRRAALVVVGNLPWVAAGLLHAGAATTDPAAAEVFALRGEGFLPAPIAALGLGGIWNVEVVPASRTGALGVAATVVLLLLVAAGAAAARRPGRDLGRLLRPALLAWVVGYAGALLTWLAPGAIGWLGAEVPGVGVLRDGARSLVLCVPLVVVLAATGAGAVHAAARRLAERGGMGPAPGVVVGLVLLAWPVALMPEAALGVGGRLSPSTYPASWAAARGTVAGLPGDVLVLPFSSYRQPGWNDDRKVLDPLPRYLRREAVFSDDLLVSQTAVDGEDPRARAAAAVLASPDADERASGLADLGVGVVVEDGPDGLRVSRVPGPARQDVPRVDVVVMGLAWAAWTAAVAAGVLAGPAAVWTARRRRRVES